MTSRAGSLPPSAGAKPPSSPTVVPRPRSRSTAFSAPYTSATTRSPVPKLDAPSGMTMNSWKSVLSSACLPPLRMFAMGTGSVRAIGPPR